MKRQLIASILGITASVVSSYGQGQILFITYGSNVYPGVQVVWGDTAGGHTAGHPVVAVDGFNAELYYGLGSGLSFNQLAAIPSSVTPVGSYPGGEIPGYILGGAVTLPGWTSGSVTYGISVWNGPGYGLGTYESLNNVTWTEPDGSFSAFHLVPAFPDGLAVYPVPEPGMLTLAGLGAVVLAAFRRSLHLKV